MRVLSIYPGMTKERNDNAHVLIELNRKNVEMEVITSRSLGLKGNGFASEYENMDGIEVHRLFRKFIDMVVFPGLKLDKCLQIAGHLRPDLIFCSHLMNMRLALALQKSLHVPIVLLVENGGRIKSGESKMPLPFRFLMLSSGVTSAQSLWEWLCKKSATIITCNPRDIAKLSDLSENSCPIYYLPWPTFLPPNFDHQSFNKKFTGVYVGSLSPSKNTQEFETTLPRILSETYTKEFVVVGPGPHAKMIKALNKKTHGAIKYLPGLPRLEALKLIAESYYAYTPVVHGGWGFIGDCWCAKTPIVMTHNDNYVSNGENALVAGSPEELISAINSLYENRELFEKLSNNGFEKSKKMDAKAVAEQLYAIFFRTLENEN